MSFERVRLGQIARFINGRAYKNSEFKTEGTPIVRIQNLSGGGKTVYSDLELPADKYIDKYDLIYAWSATFGPHIWKGQKSIYHYHIWKVEPFKGTDKYYLYYLLKLISDQISTQGTGSIFAHITKGLMESYEVDVLPYKEQIRISQILKSIDDKIQINQQINQTLEQIAQAIFKSWFVDFDPVKAKINALAAGGSEEDALLAAMQAISGKDKAQLTQLQTENPEHYDQLRTTAELFPSAMQDSELGEIPEGWNYGLLSDISELNKSSWTKRTLPSEIEYVDLANTKNGIIENTSRYAANEAPSRARRKLSKGDTIIGTVRPGNRSYAFIYDDSNMLTGSTGFAVLTPENRHFAEFLYIKATSEQSIDYLAHLADGGAYPAVRAEVVSSVPSILPSDALVRRFHHTVSPYFKSIGENNKESSLLTKVKLALLPKLLSGEILMAHANESLEVD
jgi:type I restriction enzyme S subunit